MTLPISKLPRPGMALLGLLTLCGTVGPVAAEESAGDRGRRLFAAKSYAEAIKAYEEAAKAENDPGYLVDIGRSYFLMNDCKNATKTYRQYLEQDNIAVSARVFVQHDIDACESAKQAKPEPSQVQAPVSPQQGPTAPATSVPEPTTAPKSGVSTQAVAAPLTPAPHPAEPPGTILGGRPTWRVAAGSAALGVGVLLSAFGIPALAINGNAVDPMNGMPGGTFHTAALGAGLLVPGLVLVAGGAVLIALPGKKAAATSK